MTGRVPILFVRYLHMRRKVGLDQHHSPPIQLSIPKAPNSLSYFQILFHSLCAPSSALLATTVTDLDIIGLMSLAPDRQDIPTLSSGFAVRAWNCLRRYLAVFGKAFVIHW